MAIAQTVTYKSSTDDLYTGSLSLDNGSYELLTYKSLQQLYYNDFATGSGTIEETGSYDHYIESSFTSASRYLNSVAAVYSIPRLKTGTHLQPHTVELSPNYTQGQVDETRYVLNDYVTATGDFEIAGDENLYIVTTSLDGPYGTTNKIMDNGEGVLFISGTNYTNVGNVIYTHGQIILTDETVAAFYIENPLAHLTWKSNQPIYTYNYNIKVSDYEYNFSQNPSAQSGSYNFEYSGSKFVRTTGVLADNITGSTFQPYITTVGLYNDANELLAVAKLAQPLPKSANTEMTIQIKLDT